MLLHGDRTQEKAIFCTNIALNYNSVMGLGPLNKLNYHQCDIGASFDLINRQLNQRKHRESTYLIIISHISVIGYNNVLS